jgi:hypothetical protein
MLRNEIWVITRWLPHELWFIIKILILINERWSEYEFGLLLLYDNIGLLSVWYEFGLGHVGLAD